MGEKSLDLIIYSLIEKESCHAYNMNNKINRNTSASNGESNRESDFAALDDEPGLES